MRQAIHAGGVLENGVARAGREQGDETDLSGGGPSAGDGGFWFWFGLVLDLLFDLVLVLVSFDLVLFGFISDFV